MVDPLAAAFLGGLLGFAIGADGKVVPVSQEQVNKLLREQKPKFVQKVDIDTSIARGGTEKDGEFQVSGSFILVVNPGVVSKAVYIKLNEPEWPELPLTSLRRVVGPFYRFFIKNEAGTGTLNLIIARGYQFQFIEGEISLTGPILDKLNSIGDVNVPAPADNELLKYDFATSTWIAEALLAAGVPAHKTSHEDGGADEIGVAGLSGLLADAQTPLAHKTSHQDGGADELNIAGLVGHTKEFFVPCHHGTDATEFYLGWVIDGANERCHIHIMIPQDFTTIISAEIIIHAVSTNPSMEFSITTWYGAPGEAYNTHQEASTPTIATTADVLGAIDISGDLESLAAGDHVVVRVAHLNNTNANIKGVRFRYS